MVLEQHTLDWHSPAHDGCAGLRLHGAHPGAYRLGAELEEELRQAEESLKNRQGGMLLKQEVDAEDIAHVVAKWTGIPVSKLLEGEMEKLIYMEDRIHQRLVDQEEAVQAVADAIRRSRRDRPGIGRTASTSCRFDAEIQAEP